MSTPQEKVARVWCLADWKSVTVVQKRFRIGYGRETLPLKCIRCRDKDSRTAWDPFLWKVSGKSTDVWIRRGWYHETHSGGFRTHQFVPQAISCQFHVRLYTKFCTKPSNILQDSTTLSAEKTDAVPTTCFKTREQVNIVCTTRSAHIAVYKDSRSSHHSQCHWRIRRGSKAARLLGLRFRIPPRAWLYVSCERCVLSSRGPCDGPIARPEEYYQACKSECDWGTS